ncbi:MAG: DNA polymerase I [Spirochaetales bacterium]|uniref:DNA polymerase I n=1 Tax=Candidatus Thalassospirochaeta sargassi TaxID=3119039 RepID=A0AAJ1IL09_9SPIO|nr:DNA polymerase I [Spirochaetales bacterium]
MKEEKKALYLLDGYSLIYRSYFAFINRPLLNSEGFNTSAVFGFFRSIAALFENHKPEFFGVVLDSTTPTFRHERYPEYKANREKAPDDLHAQVPVIKEVLKAMNIKSVRMDGYEADDIIAYFAKKCVEEGRECYIITGDKDLLQLVGSGVKIMKPDKGDYQILDEPDVADVWGVRPDQIIDYLALTGDSADNVPGVKGIGPKTAVKLLSEFDTLEGVYDRLDSHSAGVKKKLEADRENAFLSRELVTLAYDFGLTAGPEDLPCTELDRDAGARVLRKYEVNSIADRIDGKSSSSADDGGGSAKVPRKTVNTTPRAEIVYAGISGLGARNGVAGGPGEYEAVTTIEALRQWVARVKKAGWFAFDTETTDLDSMKAVPVGFSLSVEAGKGCYIPFKAAVAAAEVGSDPAQEANPEVKTWFDEDELREALREILEDESLKLIGQNIKYDYKVMKRWGIEIKNIAFDTMTAAWILDSSLGSYNMDLLAERALGYSTVHYADIVGKDETFDRVPLDSAVLYAAEDADITFRLYKSFAPEIEERGKTELFETLELPLVKILADMEMRGINLNPEFLQDFGIEVGEQLKKIKEEIYELCGEEFNINSTKQLQEILFEKRGLKPVKKTKTGYSTNVQVLEILAEQDPVPEKILEHRGLAKLKSTYIDTLPVLINPETGRIHTQLIQTGTATGRLSSKDPNLQNIPIKSENGRKIREAFIPADGCKFLSADYSQIELVVLAHLSGDEGLQKAFTEGEDVHKQTAAMIFGVFPEMVTAEQRRVAKTINFGVMYGMSAFRLSRELKIPRKQADEFIGAYFNRYSRIQEFIEKIGDEARETGTVRTIMGHERYIHGINSRNATERAGAERIALNTPIQGSAADIVKLAMLKINSGLQERGFKSKLLLQVHDELIFEVPDHEIDEMKSFVRETMESVIKLDVPLRVSIETGNNWGELH